jgi:hypothetical protein
MRLPAIVLILFSVCSVKTALCQSGELIVLGQTGKLYLEHTVVVKENWYSVGRLYNISPKVLAPYNHHTLEQPLTLGQTLEIPLTATNFSQNELKTPAETLVPLIHITQEKEWMYRISVNHNKVPIANLEKWNHINKDQVHPGMHLIVGFLKVKTALSALATTAAPVVASATHPPVSAAIDPPLTANRTDTSVTAHPKDAPGAGLPVVTRQEPPPPPVTRPASATSSSAPHFDGGVFRSEFTDEGHSLDGQAGVFKSTSGWQDGKYYALMNNVTVGTIVRITEPASGKSVYTKVLGQLPDMKESAGLAIRISNAAAAELGQGEGRFAVRVSY